jgi:hypothetical protein
MQTLVIFIENLMLSGAIVYVAYCVMCFIAFCVCWSIQKLSVKPAKSRAPGADGAQPRLLPGERADRPA